jgi:hypothetical protein
MLNYAVLQSQWKTHFHSLSDENLIEAFNQETQKKGWTTARTYFLKSCISEILERKWNLNSCVEFHQNGTVKSVSLQNPIQLINQTVILKSHQNENN